MVVEVVRKFVRDPAREDFLRRGMDTGGAVPEELAAGSVVLQATVDGKVLNATQTHALLVDADRCLCGSPDCEACQVSLQIHAHAFAQSHAEKD